MKNNKLFFYPLVIVVALSTFACEQNESSHTAEMEELNPAAKGFYAKNSDSKAIEIADEVMEAMGGRMSYEETKYLSWNFFGSRRHWWNKESGDIRIESQREDFKVKMNIHDMKGEVWKDGQSLSHQDSIAKYLERGKRMWINDSYWLVMPFKLKDSGVTLTYVGQEKSDTLHADILELKFKEVGVTPENKYHVFVDKQTRLINQWSFYNTVNDTVPRFVLPWKDYKKYGNIMLSGDRGRSKLTDISVDDAIADKLEEVLK